VSRCKLTANATVIAIGSCHINRWACH
jgi:hypothetical protein